MLPPDDLSACDLDPVVAERVFGLRVEERVNARTGQRDFVNATPSGRDWVRVAFYSGSMGAALEVEYQLHKRGWRRTEPRGRATSDVRVVLEHADGRTVEATGPANEALCRAALKAMEAAGS